MADFKKMYTYLFNSTTDALRELEQGNTIDAEYILKKAQQHTEEIFEESEPNINVVDIMRPISKTPENKQ